MIAWVDEECRKWAAHYRYLQARKDAGWNPRSLLGKLIEEGPGAFGRVSGAFFLVCPVRDDPPAYTAVSVALRKMANTHEMWQPCLIIHAHYLVWGKAKAKAPILGMSVATYWNQIDAAHAFISACVPRETEVSRQHLASA
jgi:hypothetical protein